MTHVYQHGAIFECEDCCSMYEDHPSAFPPHLCPPCEEDRDDEERTAAFGESELEMQDRWVATQPSSEESNG